MRLERSGDCHQCGKCCEVLRITAVLSQALSQHRTMEELKLYYSYRNIQVVGTDSKKDFLFLELDAPCDQLSPSNHCLVHGSPELKPLLCHAYPTEPDNISECGYRFNPKTIL
ncbi:MAG: hypothetical protein IEMM0008_0316 [bacterium]|nr:MAG: hypothetical protein IEMM0008_0316 [bacterium]